MDGASDILSLGSKDTIIELMHFPRCTWYGENNDVCNSVDHEKMKTVRI